LAKCASAIRKFGARHDAETIAGVTGLALKDMDTSVPIESVSTGLPTPLSLSRAGGAAESCASICSGTEYLQKSGGKFFYFVSRETP